LIDLNLDKVWDAYWPLAGAEGALKDLSKLETLSPKTFQQVQLFATKFHMLTSKHEVASLRK
jgi:hypothetical protein